MPREIRRFLFIPILVFIVASVSCQSTSATDEKATGDMLVVPDTEKFAFLNPLLTTTTLSARLIDIVFDGLIKLDDRFEPKPQLAESWERPVDGRTWTFHLRPGVKFHDGVELTADDVAFTFEKMKRFSIAPTSFNSQDMQEVHVVDHYTVQITSKTPLASFLQSLDVPILPKHLLEGKEIENTSFNLHPVGTGPFKVKSWSDQEIVLEANESYFLGRPYLDKIRAIAYPDREAIWAKLMAGEVDFFDYLSAGDYEITKQVPNVRFYSVPMPYYYLVALNMEDRLFADRRVRQALNYAVNKEEIVAKVLEGQGRIAAGTIFPGSWAYNPNIAPYPYDPKKALALLAEAGWRDHDGDHFLDKDGRPFEFTVQVNAGDDAKKKTFLLIQQQLLDIGIKARLNFFDAADIGFYFKKQFQAVFPETRAGGDPDSSYKFWHSSQIQGGFNVTSYHNKTVDKLLEEGRSEFDQERRKAIYFNFQEEILKDPPGIFLYWTNYLVGIQKRFKGVKISSVSPFENIQEWYVPKAEQRHPESESPSSARKQ